MTDVDQWIHAPEEIPERLAPIIDAIRSVYEPERIILFGSAGQGLPWHDLDLLVIAETEDPFLERRKKIRAARTTSSEYTPVDMIVLTPSEIDDQLKENRFFLIEEILKKGRAVYGGGPYPPLLAKHARKTAMRDADVRDWLGRVEQDLRSATVLMDAALFPQTAFACQQAVEKVLKAFLLAKTGAYPRTHSLPDLGELAERGNASLHDLMPAFKALDDYYLPSRYPDAGGEEIDQQAATAALAQAQDVVQAIRAMIGLS